MVRKLTTRTIAVNDVNLCSCEKNSLKKKKNFLSRLPKLSATTTENFVMSHFLEEHNKLRQIFHYHFKRQRNQVQKNSTTFDKLNKA